MKHDNNLIWFDFLRGIAAFMVLIGHLRALMFEDFSKSYSLFGKLFYFVTGFYHEAVVIFFVLSGFFIIRTIHESVIRNNWNVKHYILNRVVRLWMVLLPGLIMTLLWDKIGLAYFKYAYTSPILIKKLPGINPTNQLSLTDFFGNLFFLQTIKVPTFGSNVALWSLANEFWYYMLFPLIYFAIAKYYKNKIRILLIVLFVAVLAFIGQSIALYFIIWLMGGITYVIIKNDIFLKHYLKIKILVTTLTFLFVAIMIRFEYYPIAFNDFSLGIITVFMLCVLTKIPMENLQLRKLAKSFSNISYSVYLTHFSFSILLISILYNCKIAFNLTNFFYYILLIIAIMIYCCINYYLFERNTVMVKAFLKKHIKLLRSS